MSGRDRFLFYVCAPIVTLYVCAMMWLIGHFLL